MRTAHLLKKQKGFTLIELLVVIGILAILLAIVLVAINPARQFGQADDTRRRSDIVQILNSVGAFQSDNAGTLPAGIPVSPTPAVDASFICSSIVPTYISSLPVDPTVNNGAAYTACPTPGAGVSGYSVYKDATNHVTVTATGSTGPLTVTR